VTGDCHAGIRGSLGVKFPQATRQIFHTDYRRPYSTYQDAFDAARALFFFSITWGFE
jgi:hypothetical protein